MGYYNTQEQDALFQQATPGGQGSRTPGWTPQQLALLQQQLPLMGAEGLGQGGQMASLGYVPPSGGLAQPQPLAALDPWQAAAQRSQLAQPQPQSLSTPDARQSAWQQIVRQANANGAALGRAQLGAQYQPVPGALAPVGMRPMKPAPQSTMKPAPQSMMKYKPQQSEQDPPSRNSRLRE